MYRRRVLLLGGSGVVGTAIEDVFKKKGDDVFVPAHIELDFLDFDAIRNHLDVLRPDLIINCIAMSGHEMCELYPEKALLLNVMALKNLAQAVEDIKAELVQISSSAVFDGRKNGFYCEDDLPSPVNIYGGTKYLSEAFARQWCSRCYVIRLPMIYGPRRNKGQSFIDKMIAVIRQGEKPLQVSTDEYNSPTNSLDMAEMIRLVVGQQSYGIYHVANSGYVSLFDLVKILVERVQAKVSVMPVTHDLFHRKAAIPLNGSLSSCRLPESRPWLDALQQWFEN